jgi:hypothetical protein
VDVEDGMGCHGRSGGEGDMAGVGLMQFQKRQKYKKPRGGYVCKHFWTHLTVIRSSNSIDDVSSMSG